MGHGQTFSATEKYLYVIANNHLLTNSSKSEEIMRINKNNLQIDKIWTFKIWNGDANHPRYIHNAVFVNDHEFYALCDLGASVSTIPKTLCDLLDFRDFDDCSLNLHLADSTIK